MWYVDDNKVSNIESKGVDNLLNIIIKLSRNKNNKCKETCLSGYEPRDNRRQKYLYRTGRESNVIH